MSISGGYARHWLTPGRLALEGADLRVGFGSVDGLYDVTLELSGFEGRSEGGLWATRALFGARVERPFGALRLGAGGQLGALVLPRATQSSRLGDGSDVLWSLSAAAFATAGVDLVTIGATTLFVRGEAGLSYPFAVDAGLITGLRIAL